MKHVQSIIAYIAILLTASISWKLLCEDATSSLTITTFNQSQLKPLVNMASPPPFSWATLQITLLICLVSWRNASGSTNTYPWLWSEGMLPAYWLVCKFDLISPILSVLTSITAHHLSVSMHSYYFWNVRAFCKFC